MSGENKSTSKRNLWITLSTVLVGALLATGIFITLPQDNQNPGVNPSLSPSPSPTETKDATIFDNVDDLFNPSQITDIHIEVPAKSKKILSSAYEKTWAPVTMQVSLGTKQTPVMNVCIKIKGTTSRYSINTTYAYMSFNVKFACDSAHKNQTLLGLKKLTLNAMTQDSSKIHETFAYETYRAMGIPASRTGYTHLTFSKNIVRANRGLFLVLEPLDDVFLGKNFQGVTQHLYENQKNFNEITVSNVGKNVQNNRGYQVKEGWKATPNRNDLRAFAKGIASSGQKLWDFLDTATDRSKLIMLFAADNFTGGWDTYSGTIKNNYLMRSDAQGKFTFLPWGLDNTWGENYFNDMSSTHWGKDLHLPTVYHDDFFFPLDSQSASFPGAFIIAYQAGVRDTNRLTHYNFARGAIFRKCLKFAPCATEYYQDLKKISDWATSSNLVERMKTQSTQIKSYTTSYQEAEQVRVQKWVGKQQARVAAVIKKHCQLSGTEVSSCH